MSLIEPINLHEGGIAETGVGSGWWRRALKAEKEILLEGIEVVGQVKSPVGAGIDRGAHHRNVVVLVKVNAAGVVLGVLIDEVPSQHQPGFRSIGQVHLYVVEAKRIDAIDPVVGTAKFRIDVGAQRASLAEPCTQNSRVAIDFRRRIAKRSQDANEGTAAVRIERHAYTVSTIRIIREVNVAQGCLIAAAGLNRILRPVKSSSHPERMGEVILHLEIVLLRVLADQVGVDLAD